MPKNDIDPNLVTLTLTASFHQIQLMDDGCDADLGAAWGPKAIEDRLAVTEGAIGVGTETDGEVTVSVEVLPAAPGAPRDADHVTESTLEVRSGRLVVMGCTDYLPGARRILVAAGTHRVRVEHTGIASQEKLTITLWPAPKAASAVLVRWTPPPPRRADDSTQPTALENATQAAEAARRGHTELAMEALTGLADAGDLAAAAALAQLLAFRGLWAAFVPRAEAFFARPSAVPGGNIFSDLTRLFRRAARELDRPEIIERAAAGMPDSHRRMAEATLLKDFVPPPSGTIREATPEERAAFEKAATAAAADERFAGNADGLRAHLFALARNNHIETEIHRLWSELGEGRTFEQALVVARWLAFRERRDEAWRVIEPMVPRWWPVLSAQLAPVELLYDPLLSTVMTAERCALVLATPRGPEAAAV